MTNKITSADANEMLGFVASFLPEQSSRSLVIIGAARIEEKTKDILAVVAPGFQELGSHSRRVELLVALGIVQSEMALCLKRVSEIRNYFAHTSGLASLSDAAISDKVQLLFGGMEKCNVNLAVSSDSLFNGIIAKNGLPLQSVPMTWQNPDTKKYMVSIIMLISYLVVVRNNMPPRHTPVPASDWFDAK